MLENGSSSLCLKRVRSQQRLMGLFAAAISVVVFSQLNWMPFRPSLASADAPATAPATQPFSLKNDDLRRSPFTAVRWQSSTPQVQYKGEWYEAVSIDDIPVTQIMDYLDQSKDFAPQKHFAEDLVEVMTQMRHPPGKTVKLELKAPGSDKTVTVKDAPMTEDNRRAIVRANRK